ncbi:hypothetical protein [Verrucomicrobium sp. BvORR034]|uniref:hypothetical protein n=1 Tax=Verrucomicrobium sp. BvORR034 TaxID=1396418 RepID=UPI0006795C42|nr:hypothetical protein [Verrucomicrobium sp. BvORR034]
MNTSDWKQRKQRVEQYFSQASPPKGFFAAIKHSLSAFWLNMTGKKPADHTEASRWISEARHEVHQVARLRLDLTTSSPRRTFAVESPADGAKWYKDKDRRVRASKMDFTHVFLMDYYIACYRASYDLAEQAVMQDETEEFPYAEITGFGTRMVSTSSFEVADQDDVRAKLQRRQFQVFTSSNVTLIVPFVVAKVISTGKESLEFEDEGNDTIIALRKQLVDYKRPQWEKGNEEII